MRLRISAFMPSQVKPSVWTIDAMSAASACPSTNASMRCWTVPAPPDAITGTLTASATLRVISSS